MPFTTAPAGADLGSIRKCHAAKLKAAGKHCLCRHKALVKAALKGGAADVTKCEAKFSAAFAKAELKGGGQCPSEGDSTLIDSRLDSLAATIDAALVGNGATDKKALKCRAAKLKAAGKRCLCLHKNEAKAAKKGTVADHSRCKSKFSAAFDKAQQKASGLCPTVEDSASVAAAIDGSSAEVTADLADLDTSHFGGFGPYGVGVTTTALVDTSRPTDANGSYPGSPERSLTVEIWYPADGPFWLMTRDIAMAEGGPFPLIMRAHGLGGFREDSSSLTSHLANHGYIVVAPNFPLSTMGAPGGVTGVDVDEQARDLSFLIDNLLAWNDEAANMFNGKIDATRIGATGHSLGGETILIAGFHSQLRDPRIKALVALAPFSCLFTSDFYNSASVPVMIMSGSIDLITPPQSNQVDSFAKAGPPKFLVSIEGGTHIGFANKFIDGPTNADEALFCAPLAPEGTTRPLTFDWSLPTDFLGGAAEGVDVTASACEPICPLPPATFLNHHRQQQLTLASTLGFFEAFLRGDVSAGRLIRNRLASDNAEVTLLYEE